MFMDSLMIRSILREGLLMMLRIFLPTLKTMWFGEKRSKFYSIKEVSMEKVSKKNSHLTITVRLDTLTTPKQVRKTIRAMKCIIRDVADNFTLDNRASLPMVAWLLQAFNQNEPVLLPYVLPEGVKAEVVATSANGNDDKGGDNLW